MCFPYQRGKRVPCPEGDHEAKPRKKEDTSMNINDIEHGYLPGLLVDRVKLRGLDQV